MHPAIERDHVLAVDLASLVLCSENGVVILDKMLAAGSGEVSACCANVPLEQVNGLRKNLLLMRRRDGIENIDEHRRSRFAPDEVGIALVGDVADPHSDGVFGGVADC